MRVRRFLFSVLMAYGFGLSLTTLLTYVAAVQKNTATLLLAFVGVIGITTLCGWWYFRGVRQASLRLCAEWAAVWIALFFCADLLILVFWLKQSFADIGPLAWAGYAVQGMGLLLVAWLTRERGAAADGPDDVMHSPDLRLTI